MASLDLWHLLRVIVDHVGAQARGWAALLLSFSLFVWAVKTPTLERIAAATIFMALAFVPLWMRKETPDGRAETSRADARLESARARVNGEPE